jgi:RPA family protein
MVNMQAIRLPAKKLRILDIVNGKYFPGSKEEMKASYLITPLGKKVSRVNLVATVTDKFLSEDGNYSTATIDDGSEAIRVKTFKESVKLLDGIATGDLVLVIGKIKEYNGEVYVNGEIVKKIFDRNFESLRRLEIVKQTVQQKRIVDEIRNLSSQLSEEELKQYAKEKYDMDEECLQAILESRKLEVDYKPKVLEVIETLDTGEGVEVGKLFEVLNLPEHIIENTVDELLSNGSIFEPKIGYFKKV